MSCYSSVWVPDINNNQYGGHWVMREVPCPFDILVSDPGANPESPAKGDDFGIAILPYLFTFGILGGIFSGITSGGGGKLDPRLQNGFIDIGWNILWNQCPEISEISGPCDYNTMNNIKFAWASVMQKLQSPLLTKLINYVKGCNAEIDNLLACLANLPNTDFSKGIPPGGGKILKISCDDSSIVPNLGSMSNLFAATIGVEMKINMTGIANNVGLNPNILQAVILHELVHFCGDDSELDAKWIETLFYGGYSIFGWPGPGYQVDLNVDQYGNEYLTPALKAICCASKKTWAASHGGDPNNSILLYSKNIVWNFINGDAYLYCDLPKGGKLPLDDGGSNNFNPFQYQTLTDLNSISLCQNIDLNTLDCH
jgi:hypothetical protein